MVIKLIFLSPELVFSNVLQLNVAKNEINKNKIIQTFDYLDLDIQNYLTF